MKHYTFKGILTENGWLENTTVSVDENGLITSISEIKHSNSENVNGYALPGFQNAHSHAFQYAMAGLAEMHRANHIADDFWSWRTTMYNLASTMSPDDFETIATMLYAEMVHNGYTNVAEFHYLHHSKNGTPYNNLSEMGERLMRAAEKTGIHLTLIPIFYQKGGFGKPETSKQRRFISSNFEAYQQLVEATTKAASRYYNTTIGLGIHSLRAVDEASIKKTVALLQENQPIHIHVSEQLKEIEDCLNFYNKRPIEWLLDNVNLNENWHLVHATHTNDNELIGIAKHKANVVLCPSTEGNLGDGIFRLIEFQKQEGNWSIGTDSHIGINPFEELRLLDYGQRLISHKRNTFVNNQSGNSGFNAIKMAWQSGRKAMGKSNKTFFVVGEPFDALVMDANLPLIQATKTEHLCNTFVYTCNSSTILGTIINGEWKSKNGKHLAFDNIHESYKQTLKTLGVRL